MFGRAIPARLISKACRPKSVSAVFMVGRMAERESISVDLPSRSTLFHSGLLSEFKNLIR